MLAQPDPFSLHFRPLEPDRSFPATCSVSFSAACNLRFGASRFITKRKATRGRTSREGRIASTNDGSQELGRTGRGIGRWCHGTIYHHGHGHYGHEHDHGIFGASVLEYLGVSGQNTSFGEGVLLSASTLQNGLSGSDGCVLRPCSGLRQSPSLMVLFSVFWQEPV